MHLVEDNVITECHYTLINQGYLIIHYVIMRKYMFISHLGKAPRHCSSFFVHLGASHNFFPSLEQHQRWQLLGKRRCAHLVPDVIMTKKEKLMTLTSLIRKMSQPSLNDAHYRKCCLLLRHFTVAAHIHFSKLQPCTVVPGDKKTGLEFRILLFPRFISISQNTP